MDCNPTRWPESPRIVMRCAPRASNGPNHLGIVPAYTVLQYVDLLGPAYRFVQWDVNHGGLMVSSPPPCESVGLQRLGFMVPGFPPHPPSPPAPPCETALVGLGGQGFRVSGSALPSPPIRCAAALRCAAARRNSRCAPPQVYVAIIDCHRWQRPQSPPTLRSGQTRAEARRRAAGPGAGTIPPHGLSSSRMARVTSDCGTMFSPMVMTSAQSAYNTCRNYRLTPMATAPPTTR